MRQAPALQPCRGTAATRCRHLAVTNNLAALPATRLGSLGTRLSPQQQQQQQQLQRHLTPVPGCRVTIAGQHSSRAPRGAGLVVRSSWSWEEPYLQDCGKDMGTYLFEVQWQGGDQATQSAHAEQVMVNRYLELLRESDLINKLRSRARHERPRDRSQRRFAERMDRIKWERKQPGYVAESLASAGGREYEHLHEPFLDIYQHRAEWDTAVDTDDAAAAAAGAHNQSQVGHFFNKTGVLDMAALAAAEDGMAGYMTPAAAAAAAAAGGVPGPASTLLDLQQLAATGMSFGGYAADADASTAAAGGVAAGAGQAGQYGSGPYMSLDEMVAVAQASVSSGQWMETLQQELQVQLQTEQQVFQGQQPPPLPEQQPTQPQLQPEQQQLEQQVGVDDAAAAGGYTYDMSSVWQQTPLGSNQQQVLQQQQEEVQMQRQEQPVWPTPDLGQMWQLDPATVAVFQQEQQQFPLEPALPAVAVDFSAFGWADVPMVGQQPLQMPLPAAPFLPQQQQQPGVPLEPPAAAPAATGAAAVDAFGGALAWEAQQQLQQQPGAVEALPYMTPQGVGGDVAPLRAAGELLPQPPAAEAPPAAAAEASAAAPPAAEPGKKLRKRAAGGRRKTASLASQPSPAAAPACDAAAAAAMAGDLPAAVAAEASAALAAAAAAAVACGDATSKQGGVDAHAVQAKAGQASAVQAMMEAPAATARLPAQEAKRQPKIQRRLQPKAQQTPQQPQQQQQEASGLSPISAAAALQETQAALVASMETVKALEQLLQAKGLTTGAAASVGGSPANGSSKPAQQQQQRVAAPNGTAAPVNGAVVHGKAAAVNGTAAAVKGTAAPVNGATANGKAAAVNGTAALVNGRSKAGAGGERQQQQKTSSGAVGSIKRRSAAFSR